MIAAAEPLACEAGHVRGAGLAHPLELRAVEARIVRIKPALGEHGCLAGKPAHALDTADERRIAAHAHALELLGARPRLQKTRDLRIEPARSSPTSTPFASVTVT